MGERNWTAMKRLRRILPPRELAVAKQSEGEEGGDGRHWGLKWRGLAIQLVQLRLELATQVAARQRMRSTANDFGGRR